MFPKNLSHQNQKVLASYYDLLLLIMQLYFHILLMTDEVYHQPSLKKLSNKLKLFKVFLSEVSKLNDLP